MFVPIPFPRQAGLMLQRATMEGKAAAADICSVRLEKLANHAANAGLSAAEIVELSAKKPQPLKARAVRHGSKNAFEMGRQ
jgi:hypothetical protein